MFSKHELGDVGWCFPNTFATLEFHPSTWLFAHLCRHSTCPWRSLNQCFNCFSINKPQNRYSSTCSIFTFSIFRVCIFFFADGNFMCLDFATFSDTLLILGMAASCLANMNWEMWDGVSPILSRPWNSIPRHGCLLICVDIPHVHGDL